MHACMKVCIVAHVASLVSLIPQGCGFTTDPTNTIYFVCSNS